MNRFVKLLFLLAVGVLALAQTTTSFFKFTSLTGSNHIIAWPSTFSPTINGTALSVGDEIGIFTNRGLCVGATVWKGGTGSIVAWADNGQTASVDGFLDKEYMYFRIYSAKAKKAYYATPEFTSGTNQLQVNAYTLLKGLTGTSVVSVENLSAPAYFKLSQNYPNPFNPSTKISFSLPKSSIVTITIFDLNGKEITKLIDNKVSESGSYSVEWNGKSVTGNNVSSGIYFYKLDAKGISGENFAFSQVKSMILMK